MYAAAHCHTPACMSLELWNDDTNELICVMHQYMELETKHKMKKVM